MTTFNDVSILHDVVIRMKQILASGITDPLSRGGGGSTFILSSYPKRKVSYPVITINSNFGPGTKLGMQSEGVMVPVNVYVDVWTTDVKQKDTLAGSIFNLLRTTQLGLNGTVGSGTSLERLYDFNIRSMVDFDEPGKEGLHRKAMEFGYKYLTEG